MVGVVPDSYINTPNQSLNSTLEGALEEERLLESRIGTPPHESSGDEEKGNDPHADSLPEKPESNASHEDRYDYFALAEAE